MSGISKRVSGSWVSGNYGIMKTSTDTITTLPANLYADGNNATVGISGNTVQNGTPTPSNPVEVQGVGERTGNLFDINGEIDFISTVVTIINNGIKFENVPSGNIARIIYSAQYAAGTYYISCVASGSYYTVRLFSDSPFTGAAYNSFYGGYYRDFTKSGFSTSLTFDNDFKIGFIANAAGGATFTISQIMLSTTEADYEPYGYKIPISSGGVTTNIYLGSTQTTRQIGKYIFDGSNIFTTQRSTYRNNTALFATTAMAGTGVINRPSMNNYFVVPSSGINPKTLDYACSGFHPSDQFSSYYYLRVPYDVIGMTDSNTDNEFITALNTWLSSLYNSGNPMIAYYALVTPETAAVNEPLQKIGTYADTLSNAASIPTTEGANSITIDTTVQPSEFTATYTGWHDASVKEKSENLAYDILVQDLQPVYSIVLLFSADLEPDTTYTLSFDSISGFYFYINEQVFNVKYIKTVTGRNQVICTTKSALDKSDNRQYLDGRWIILKNAMSQPTNIDITNVMLNTGSTALPYEPYWK